MKKTSLFTLAALALSASTLARADEGMWMPQQIPDLAPRLREIGYSGDPKIFADLTGHPMGAIVSLGGCSASFVSPDGLIVTNHHCVQGSLQYNSTPERNLIENGYLARTRDEELWNGPGSRVFVTVSVREVTDLVTGNMPKKKGKELPPRERYDVLERRIKELTAACEKSGLRCNIQSFFEGLKYFELGLMEINDVRLVYAPPAGIGNYGGETDNWQWPRHTGDFSFYRAYVGKDGKPAPYAKDNVPYKPKHFLKVSAAGANPGDLILVAGYPGRTFRHETFAEVKERTEWTLPRGIARSKETLAILDEVTRNNKELEIKAEPRKRGLNNGLTKNQGVLQGLIKGGLLAEKEAREKALLDWIAAEPGRKTQYGDIFPALSAMQAEQEKTRERNSAFSALYRSAELLNAADDAYRLALEKPKKDADRDPAYQERNWKRLRERLERMQKSYAPELDKALLRYVMMEGAGLPAGVRIDPLDKLAGLSAGLAKEEARKKIDSFLEATYSKTSLGKPEARLALLEKSAAEIAKMDDPVVKLALALHPMAEALREKEKERAGQRSILRPRHMQALLAKEGGLVAPDANSTLRVTFGRVMGVDSRDGIYFKPQTTLQGVLDKHTGKDEFDATQKLLDAAKALRAGKKTPYFDARMNDVPVNFLSDVDTTGGNSGSAVLNQKGELIGLLFDGTYETVASDFLFDKKKTRSIQVDSRYMLWVMTEVDGARHLVEEMGIK